MQDHDHLFQVAANMGKRFDFSLNVPAMTLDMIWCSILTEVSICVGDNEEALREYDKLAREAVGLIPVDPTLDGDKWVYKHLLLLTEAMIEWTARGFSGREMFGESKRFEMELVQHMEAYLKGKGLFVNGLKATPQPSDSLKDLILHARVMRKALELKDGNLGAHIIVLSRPDDYVPVCSTELGAFAKPEYGPTLADTTVNTANEPGGGKFLHKLVGAVLDKVAMANNQAKYDEPGAWIPEDGVAFQGGLRDPTDISPTIKKHVVILGEPKAEIRQRKDAPDLYGQYQAAMKLHPLEWADPKTFTFNERMLRKEDFGSSDEPAKNKYVTFGNVVSAAGRSLLHNPRNAAMLGGIAVLASLPGAAAQAHISDAGIPAANAFAGGFGLAIAGFRDGRAIGNALYYSVYGGWGLTCALAIGFSASSVIPGKRSRYLGLLAAIEGLVLAVIAASSADDMDHMLERLKTWTPLTTLLCAGALLMGFDRIQANGDHRAHEC